MAERETLTLKQTPLTQCRVDVTAKFNEVPVRVQESPTAVKVTLVTTDGQQIEFDIKPKAWKKFNNMVNTILKANPDAQWVGSAGGSLAGRTGQGFRMNGVGIQVFEKKPKPLKVEQG